jgi:copper chaperone CopZ
MAVEHYTLGIDGMTCNGCASHLGDVLSAIPGVTDARVDLAENRAVVCVSENGPDRKVLAMAVTGAGYTVVEPGSLQGSTATPGQQQKSAFNWRDRVVWRKSAGNTKWCLIGCSIGEFGTLAAYQVLGTAVVVAPATFLYYFLLLLPLINGLITSVILETILLMRGQMNFRKSLSTALGMSFISMLMMEVAMEITDLVATGGQLGMNYYAIPVMLIAGFITPWPYNYWRLKKHGAACH